MDPEHILRRGHVQYDTEFFIVFERSFRAFLPDLEYQ